MPNGYHPFMDGLVHLHRAKLVLCLIVPSVHFAERKSIKVIISHNGEMVSSPDKVILVKDKNGNEHYVEGFLFVKNKRSGEESIQEIIRIYNAECRIPFEIMYGSFEYIIKKSNETIYFACNSLMRSIYISEIGVSNSFLELVQYMRAQGKPCSFNPRSVCEYYSLGNIFFGKTIVNEISILDHGKYIRWDQEGMRILDKGIGGLDSRGTIDNPRDFFRSLSVALENKKVALSLTGGYDSRLIYSQLYDNILLYLFITANMATKDSEAASRVAEATGQPLDIIRTEKPDITEEYIVDRIKNSDGIRPLDLDGDSRLANAKAKLDKQGVNLQLTGDGGVLHKDWEWMQDLPFYHKKTTDLRKFYRQRIAFAVRAPFCGEFIDDAYRSQEAYFLKEMEKYKKDINTRSYDSLYYYVNGNRSNWYNCISNSEYTLYAPLTEFDMVRYSYRLPRLQRFFYNNMRKMITQANPKIARIPTNYGTTASSETFFLLRDVPVQLKEYFVKAKRLLRRKLKLKPKEEEILDWTLEPDVRALELSEKSVCWAIEKKILAPNAKAKDIPYDNLCRLIHIYVLHSEYDIV